MNSTPYVLLLSYLGRDRQRAADTASPVTRKLICWGLLDGHGAVDESGVSFVLRLLQSPQSRDVFSALPPDSAPRLLWEELLAKAAPGEIDSFSAVLRGVLDKPSAPAEGGSLRAGVGGYQKKWNVELDSRVALGQEVLTLAGRKGASQIADCADLAEPRLVNAGGQPKLILSVRPDLLPLRPELNSPDAVTFKTYQLLAAKNESAARELTGERRARALRAWLTMRGGEVVRLSGQLRVHINARALRVELYAPRPSPEVRSEFNSHVLGSIETASELAWPLPVKRRSASDDSISVSWSYCPEKLPPSPGDAEQIVQFIWCVWQGVSRGLARARAEALATSVALGSFAEFRVRLGPERRTFSTLGGRASFMAHDAGGDVRIENSNGSQLFVDERLFDSVAARYVSLAAKGTETRLMSANYTDPSWGRCPSRVVAPYLPAIFESLDLEPKRLLHATDGRSLSPLALGQGSGVVPRKTPNSGGSITPP